MGFRVLSRKNCFSPLEDLPQGRLQSLSYSNLGRLISTAPSLLDRGRVEGCRKAETPKKKKKNRSISISYLSSQKVQVINQTAMCRPAAPQTDGARPANGDHGAWKGGEGWVTERRGEERTQTAASHITKRVFAQLQGDRYLKRLGLAFGTLFFFSPRSSSSPSFLLSATSSIFAAGGQLPAQSSSSVGPKMPARHHHHDTKPRPFPPITSRQLSVLSTKKANREEKKGGGGGEAGGCASPPLGQPSGF